MKLMVLALVAMTLSLSAQATNAPIATPPVISSHDPFADPLIAQVQARHQAGVEGDKKAVEELIPWLEKLTQDQPQNQLLRAYLGSAYTLESRDLFPGPGKLKYLRLGLRTMDAAVAAAPNDVAVRFVRAINNFSLPAFINRKSTARDDFQILLKEIRDPAERETFNLETRQAIYLYAGLSYQELHQRAEAADAWQEGLRLGVDTVLGKKIAIELTKLK